MGHLLFMVVAAVLVTVLARTLRETAAQGEGREPLARAGRRLKALLWAQLALGLASYLVVWTHVGPEVKSIHGSIYPTLHVLTGALLLAQCVTATLWSRKVVSRSAAQPAGALAGEAGGVA